MADHITKKGQQQLAGALILGTLMAVADAQNPYTPQSVRNQNMENAMVAGAGVGGMAYSQTYELEADMIGTHIAEAAGYDAELGSRVLQGARMPRTLTARLASGAHIRHRTGVWRMWPQRPERLPRASLCCRALRQSIARPIHGVRAAPAGTEMLPKLRPA